MVTVDSRNSKRHEKMRQKKKDSSQTAQQIKNNSEKEMTVKIKRRPRDRFSLHKKYLTKEN